MTNERELLRRALVYLSGLPARSSIQDEIEAYLSTPSDDAEEPVAWMYPDDIERFKTNETFAQAYSIKCGSPTQGTTEPLYLHPAPQRSFVRLSEEEICIVMDNVLEGGGWSDVARAIEDALEEKNK